MPITLRFAVATRVREKSSEPTFKRLSCESNSCKSISQSNLTD